MSNPINQRVDIVIHKFVQDFFATAKDDMSCVEAAEFMKRVFQYFHEAYELGIHDGLAVSHEYDCEELQN